MIPSSSFNGLSSREALSRLQQYGPNTLPEPRWTFLSTLKDILTDPMGLMLLALSLIYFVTGHTQESWIMAAACIPVFGVDMFLELKSQRALAALKKTLSPRCHVIRDGQRQQIATSQLVPGDLLLFEEGQVLPADGIVKQSTHLSINEASLTGESIPIDKEVGQPFLSGTTVLTGHGIGEIQKTGAQSQYGQIASVLTHFEQRLSPLHQKIRTLVKWGGAAAVLLALTMFALGYFRTHDLIGSLIGSLTVAMAMIPEEFPLVFTLYLSLASYRLSKKGILIKSLPTAESLSYIDVVCTDKTGTLTEGRFEMVGFYPLSPVPVPLETSHLALLLACEPLPTDSMEVAIHTFLETQTDIPTHLKEWTLSVDYPFELKGKHLSHIWTHNSGDTLLVMKGAIEGILEHCALTESEKKGIETWIETHTIGGERLLGLAMKKGHFTGDREQDEAEALFLGVAVFSDPIREDVPRVITRCQEVGLQLKMVTGDHLMTAHAITEKIGLQHQDDQLFTGHYLEGLSVQERARCYEEGVVFARLSPHQKLELIDTLEAKGHHVAMIGDGINDAPALKRATVGISMGKNASDIARSAAEIVALKSNFSSLIDTILEGQRIKASLDASFSYLIAFHVPIIGISLFVMMTGISPILVPIHIVLLELLAHPISALGFDQIHPTLNVKRNHSIFNKSTVIPAIFRGSILTVFSLIIFILFNKMPWGQSASVLAIILGNAGLYIAEKRKSTLTFCHLLSIKTVLIVTCVLTFGALVVQVPYFATLFHLSPLPYGVLISLVLGGLGLPIIADELWRIWIPPDKSQSN